MVGIDEGNRERLKLDLGKQLNFDKYRMFHRVLSQNISAFFDESATKHIPKGAGEALKHEQNT